MQLTSYLPDAPERLAILEAWLAVAVLLFGVLAAVSGYIAVKVRGHRATIEKRALEKTLSDTEAKLSNTGEALDSFRQESSEAETKLRSELAEAKKKSDDLEAKYAPRRLTPEQRGLMIPILSKFKGRNVAFGCRLMDGESCDYTTELAKLFLQAGWNVPPPIKAHH